MDEDFDRSVVLAFRRFLEYVVHRVRPEDTEPLTPLGARIAEHLGTDPRQLAMTAERFAPHRLVDLDRAFAALAADGDVLLGVSGGQNRSMPTFSEMVDYPHFPFGLGPVDYVTQQTGHDTTTQAVQIGLRLVRHRGVPLAVLQRAADPTAGSDALTVEVLGGDTALVSDFLDTLRGKMREHSVLRGAVLVMGQPGSPATRFLPRPAVAAEEVVLPEGVLDVVVGHVLGIGEQREALRAAGQHLKRGVLLYGPPGTGKTLTVRHLVGRAVDATVIVLGGAGIEHIDAAAQLARTFQPALVVLEDIDLVATERSSFPQPLLFRVLDAIDGLDGDADIAFIMTTNRVDVMERALVQRPGRVDLAVEIPLPALPERRRLFRRYAAALPLTQEALDRAAERAQGTTGSFAKELVRRAVLAASAEGRPVADLDVERALDALLDDREALTRNMLGSAAAAGSPPSREDALAFDFEPLPPVAGSAGA